MIFNPTRYVISYIGLNILIVAVFYVLERFMGFSAGSGVSAVIPMLAAMIEGTKHFEQTKERPTGGQMWKAAFLMTVIAFVVSFALLILISGTVAPSVLLILKDVGIGVLSVGGLIVFALTWAMSRLGYGLGIKTQAKSAG